MPLQQITIIGTGLIGGSFGLAVKASGSGVRIIGCDRPHVLERARKMGALDSGNEDPAEAIKGSDLILLATPVGTIIDLIERIGPIAPPNCLITDVGSTKQEIMERARAVFGADAGERFLGGHPMAGKEHSSIFSADATLFRDATWFFVPANAQQNLNSEKVKEYRNLLERIGAHVTVTEADRHDRICAWISHLPQMISTALAGILLDEFGDASEFHTISSRGLREMTRTASSPYSMWRDVAHTNTANLEQAIAALEQRLAHIRENLRTQELKEQFERANRFEVGKP
ncbi:MAG TPA: prephenate dehydrogenase/arogenate dehydrogenase family protein [Candidatus Angelobacter sp.]|nr:prephenate dehydrogenase/arogenate dehydrogenase family protein [Candidatus Angelobacter sp.]